MLPVIKPCPRCQAAGRVDSFPVLSGERFAVICTVCRFEGNTRSTPRFGTAEQVQRLVIDDWNNQPR